LLTIQQFECTHNLNRFKQLKQSIGLSEVNKLLIEHTREISVHIINI